MTAGGGSLDQKPVGVRNTVVRRGPRGLSPDGTPLLHMIEDVPERAPEVAEVFDRNALAARGPKARRGARCPIVSGMRRIPSLPGPQSDAGYVRETGPARGSGRARWKVTRHRRATCKTTSASRRGRAGAAPRRGTRADVSSASRPLHGDDRTCPAEADCGNPPRRARDAPGCGTRASRPGSKSRTCCPCSGTSRSTRARAPNYPAPLRGAITRPFRHITPPVLVTVGEFPLRPPHHPRRQSRSRRTARRGDGVGR